MKLKNSTPLIFLQSAKNTWHRTAVGGVPTQNNMHNILPTVLFRLYVVTYYFYVY